MGELESMEIAPTLANWRRLAKRIGMTEVGRNVARRKCGTCTQCCTMNSVAGLTRQHEMCIFQTETGCSSYRKRPPECKEFYCGWRLGFGRQSERPDHVGGHWEWSEHQKPVVLHGKEYLRAAFRLERVPFDVSACVRAGEQIQRFHRAYLGIVTLELSEGDQFISTPNIHEFAEIAHFATLGYSTQEIIDAIGAPPPDDHPAA